MGGCLIEPGRLRGAKVNEPGGSRTAPTNAGAHQMNAGWRPRGSGKQNAGYWASAGFSLADLPDGAGGVDGPAAGATAGDCGCPAEGGFAS